MKTKIKQKMISKRAFQRKEIGRRHSRTSTSSEINAEDNNTLVTFIYLICYNNNIDIELRSLDFSSNEQHRR